MRILLIDDNSTSIFLTELLFKREGLAESVRSFLLATDALRYLEQALPAQVPEVIFLDLNMPVMDGWEFLNALQPHAAALAERCRIYILTSSLAPADAERAKEYALVTGLIHKPIDAPMLRAILETISEQSNKP